MTYNWHCTHPGCSHQFTHLKDHDFNEALYMGNQANSSGYSAAHCICCANAGVAPVLRRDGTEAEPFPCDLSVQRCSRCLITGGQHATNCPRHPTTSVTETEEP